jgi:hypothetical protein
LRYIELNDLRRGHITRPVERLRLIPTNNEYVLFINDHNLALGDLPIVDFEGGPAEGLEVVECVLVQLREIEELLREAVRLASFAALVEKLLESLVLR